MGLTCLSFNEELGFVAQVLESDIDWIKETVDADVRIVAVPRRDEIVIWLIKKKHCIHSLAVNCNKNGLVPAIHCRGFVTMKLF